MGLSLIAGRTGKIIVKRRNSNAAEINLVDLLTLMTPLACALSAGVAAKDARMGWCSLLFAAGGLGLGVGASYLVRLLGYSILYSACKSKAPKILGCIGIVAYMLIPMAAMILAAAGIAGISAWLARHFAG